MSDERKRVAILISGRGSNMTALLRDMEAPDHPCRPVLVASNRPEAGGLGLASARGVPTCALDHRQWGRDREGFERALTAELEKAQAELVCLAGFMRLLTPWFVARWRDRLVNIHPSLLPLFKGLDTHGRALAAGVAVHGCTVHLVREEMDAGPILGQAALPVLPGDDPATLAARVMRLEHRLYPACLRAYASGALRPAGEIAEGARVALWDDAAPA
ncbi:MAG: phosphoribosylglycinamide formyltransferase [Rubrimonas sp.]|uniref:phosphoribosylglycinamide formyltransferase n=1 Tax=Rubrimonas sp. TaxID=2036015 RepID=UPI002FDD51FC